MKNMRSFLNIVLSIAVTMLLVALLISGFIFALVESEGLALVKDSNIQLMREVGYHLSYLNRTGFSFCQTQFNDSDVQSLLCRVDEVDAFDVAQILRRINKMLAANEMVESVLLYNGRSGKFYSTEPLSYQRTWDTAAFLQSDTSYSPAFTMLRPVYNDITHAYDHMVLSYVMAERDSATGAVLSAVVVNVNTQWLHTNLLLNDATENQLLVVDAAGRILLDTHNTNDFSVRFLQPELLHKIGESSFVSDANGQKSVYTCVPVQRTDWTLLHVQPYTAFRRFAQVLRSKLLGAVLFSLLLGIPLAFFMAKKIHKPISQLFAHIREQTPQTLREGKENGDIADLINVFDSQHTRLLELEQYREKSEQQLQTSKLKSVMLDSGTQTASGRQAILGEADEPILVTVLKVIGLQQAVPRDEVNERNLIRFAIANVTQELLSQYGVCQVVSMSAGKVAVLVWPNDKQLDLQLFAQSLAEISRKMFEILQLSLSAFYDWSESNAEALRDCYKRLSDFSEYTLLLGEDCVVAATALEEQNKRTPMYPVALEQALLDCLSEVSQEKAYAALDTFLQSIHSDSVQGFRACVGKLALALQTFVQRINQNKISKITLEFDPVLPALQAAQTDGQVRAILMNLIAGIVQQMPYRAQQKNKAVVVKAKDYIDAHYQEKAICSKMIATQLAISAPYLNALFKDAYGCAVQEYLNQVRLEHAQALVLHTSKPIAQIVEDCGLETSSFYRLYKAQFSVSPKEQRIHQKLKNQEKEHESAEVFE